MAGDLLPRLTDTHCHLDLDAFDEDRLAVIERARQVGVERILIPGIDLNSSQAAISLAETFPEVYAAVGLHPNEALKFETGTIAELETMTAHPKVVAIGEIGLDYYRDWAPQNEQRRILKLQLDLAARVNKPVILHNRDASQDLLSILEGWKQEVERGRLPLTEHPGVLHSFSAEEETALRGINLGFFIGVTGPVTFKNAAGLQNVIASLPLDSLLVETDAPYLTPLPHRGHRNEPAYVRFTVEKIASLKNQPMALIAEKTTENANRLFNW